MASKKGKTICVYSGKGGVGKTTTVLNLAGIYGIMKKKCLILDFDLSNGAIALTLNKGIDKTLYNLYDDLTNNRYHDITDYTLEYNEYIDFIAAPQDPRQATKIDYKYVDIIIDRAAYLYDIILIDMSHITNDINLAILDNVDKIVLLLTNDIYSLKNIKSLINIFNDLTINKFIVVQNDSIIPSKRYYSPFDIKNIIKANIDFVIPDNFFNKNYDNYVIDGIIYTTAKKLPLSSAKGIEILSKLALKLVEKGDNHE